MARLAASSANLTAAPATVLSPEETLVTSLKPAGGYATLSGELQAAIQVRGQAPVGGRVTEVLVKPGQQVSVGDPVLRVESHVKAPGSQDALRKQNAAEAAQVAAAKQEDALQARIAARQEKLEQAQERVARAQERVALAKTIVSRLTRGENVTRADVAALATPELAVRLAARGTGRARREELRETARRDAQHETEKSARKEAWSAARKAAESARREADKALVAAAAARREAQNAAKGIAAKKQAFKDAQTQLAKLEEQGTKGADLEAARNLLNLTQSAAHNASDKAEALQKEAARQEADAEKLRLAANDADAKLAKLPDPTVDDKPAARATAKPTPEATTAPAESISASDAAQLASSALDESAAAAAQAEQLKKEIDSYARQVESLHNKLTTTSQNLESAQMQVVESKIAEKLEDVRAPASGVVLNVSEPSRDVAQGETIIAIGRPDRLEVKFSDASDAWKTLKVGAQLPATVVMDGAKMPVLAEVQEVAAPSQNEAAQITLLINNPRRSDGTGRRFRAGLNVLCSIPRPGARSALSIPSAALWRDENGQNLVAVLVPLAPATPTSAEAQDAAQNEAPSESPSEFLIEWRTVTTAAATPDGLLQEIAGGLQPGERIALRPAPLRELTLAHGGNALVRLAA